ncbi:MAG TPA: branched-chain amino acid ABC transporter permease [Acidimicrobiia bacterium]|jgi:sulfate-transporting ATPase|nr:branched-chain amino acid ABC transporter permease [Acidimicrobiia bacterium]
MSKLLQVLVIGTIAGSIYGFIAIGMVLVYRTTGVLNVAHGGIGILSGYVAHEIINIRHQSYYAGIGGGIAVAALLGLLFELIVVRRLPGRPDLQTAATLGLYTLLLGVVVTVPWWTTNAFQVLPSPLLNKTFRVPGANQAITYDQVVLLVALALFSAGLYWMLRRTRIGLAMRAVSDSSSAAGLMGIKPEVVSRVLWIVGFGLSGLTTVLVAPITLLDANALSLLTLKALTVAFIGGLVSLPLTVAGGLILGSLEAFNDLYLVDFPDLKYAWPFVLMVVALVWRAAEKRRSVRDDAPVVAAAA